MTDEFGEPELDLDAAIADATLREALADLPESGVDVGDGPDRIAMIEGLITAGWPDDAPPTMAELADDPGFADFMAAVGPGDESGPDAVAEQHNDHGDTSDDWYHADPGTGTPDLPDSSHDDG